MRPPLLLALLLSPLVLRDAPAPAPQPAPRAARPNVLLILADDLGWSDVSMHGSRFHKTPHIDALAAQGVRFSNGYAASPMCSPTRASILTGQVPARLGFTLPMGHLPEARTQGEIGTENWPDLRAVTPVTATRIAFEHTTLAEAFQAAGYETALFGKWHLGQAPHTPEAHGFDVVVGGNPEPGPSHYFPPYGAGDLGEEEPGEYLTDRLTERFLEWLQTERDKPFLACLWFYQVHAPFEARPDLRKEAAARVDPSDPQRSPTYAAMVHALDDAVGQVMAALEELDLAEDTLVVFSSDNGGNQYDTILGDVPGDPGAGLPPTRNLPLRGGKATLQEGGVRVPFAFRWPGHLAAGRVDDALIASTDLYPTLLDLAGLPLRPEQHKDGFDLAPRLRDPDAPAPRESYVCHFPHEAPITGSPPSSSIRRGDWKLERQWCEGPGGANVEHLFDLAADPAELDDRAKEEPERAHALAAELDAHLAAVGALLPIPNPLFDPRVDEWTAGEETELSTDSGALVLSGAAKAPWIATPYVPPVYGAVTFECELRTRAPGPLALRWSTSRDPVFRRSRVATAELESDGEWHPVRLDLRLEPSLTQLRLDPISAPGTVELRGLRLINVGGEVVRTWPDPR